MHSRKILLQLHAEATTKSGSPLFPIIHRECFCVFLVGQGILSYWHLQPAEPDDHGQYEVSFNRAVMLLAFAAISPAARIGQWQARQ